MIRRGFTFVLLFCFLGAVRGADNPIAELPADGKNALKGEYDKWGGQIGKFIGGDAAPDPKQAEHQAAVDAMGKWATYRLTWGEFEREPGKMDGLVRDFDSTLRTIKEADLKAKSNALAEMFTKASIAHAAEVMDTLKPIARLNAARILARIPSQAEGETTEDVLIRLGPTGQGDLAEALATIIKKPGPQYDAERLYAFKALRSLLSLPQAMPPALPREKEETAIGAVLTFLKDRNLPMSDRPREEVEGFRYLRREALRALALCPFPTLADKRRPTLDLLKFVARDGVQPEPRLDERVEAAIGVARARPEFDKDYQPDYAAAQLGLFIVDFADQRVVDSRRSKEEQVTPWKVYASRLIEALDLMKAQTMSPYVAKVVDESEQKVLSRIEKALLAPNPSDLKQVMDAAPAPVDRLYKGVDGATVKPADRKDEGPPKPEDKKDKPEDKKDKAGDKKDKPEDKKDK